MKKIDEQTIKFFEDESKKIKCKFFINEERDYLSIDGFLFKEDRIPFTLEHRIDATENEITNISSKGTSIKKHKEWIDFKYFFAMIKHTQNF